MHKLPTMSVLGAGAGRSLFIHESFRHSAELNGVRQEVHKGKK